jgi:hypothetical protein
MSQPKLQPLSLYFLDELQPQFQLFPLVGCRCSCWKRVLVWVGVISFLYESDCWNLQCFQPFPFDYYCLASFWVFTHPLMSLPDVSY